MRVIQSVDSILNSYSLILNSELVSINSHYFRPTEVDLLIGDPAKAKEAFGWEAKTKSDELAKLMSKEDYIKVLRRGF